MEEDEESVNLTQRHSCGFSHTCSYSQPSVYCSAHSNLDRISQLTLYQNVSGTLFGSAISMNSVESAMSTRSVHSCSSGDSLTARSIEPRISSDKYDQIKDDEARRGCRSNSHYVETRSLCFRDGQCTIDFVLVWDEHNEEAITYKSVEMRRIFEENLEHEGLKLEYEKPEPNGLNFIKIHAPIEVLRRYAEILKLRMPMKNVAGFRPSETSTNIIVKEVNSFFRRLLSKFDVNQTIFPTMKHQFTAVYSRDKEYLFDSDIPEFFSPGTRSRIVHFILDRTTYTEDKENDFAFGIDRLIAENAYVAAYPLHDGDPYKLECMRSLLYTEWASVKKCLHRQPLDYVKDYFGIKIGLYFAWLGFYTQMLIPASIVGLLCFLYSCLTLYSNKPSEDICSGNLSLKMCPLCDKLCDYWDLKDTCFHARVTYLFDNSATVFFAVFMSFWATMFLELWKRYSAEITHRWDLTRFDIKEEHPRPQYLARLAHVKKQRTHVITDASEPHLSFWKMKLPAIIFSSSVVLLLIAVAVVTVLAVILYRISVLAVLSFYKDTIVTSYAILFTTVTAACLNLCCIVILNSIYIRLAEYLTEIELLRTQTEFDDSLTLKIYLLQFVNYYASIFYIAFFKGKFVGYPSKYIRFFTLRQEECGPGGCLLELSIQLIIIMIGKQTLNTILEMVFPLFYKWLNTVKVHVGREKDRNKEKSMSRINLQWVKDYKLVEWGPRSLFREYLEMVLQYGFVTIFVAAFPLAPFFALINNIFEMRFDAKKLLIMFRRPVGQRVRDIGVWFRILDVISKLSVITNGFIIAFTSNFIPRLVYMKAYSNSSSLEGFLENSLSKFNTSHFNQDYSPQIQNDTEPIKICWYPDYREAESGDYKHTIMYWHILAARLAFVVVFENIVALVMILVRWCIPNMSQTLQDQIRREAYITNEIIIKQETLRVCGPCRTGENISQSNSNTVTMQRLDRVMQKSLSNAELDLEIHGSPVGAP
ncbi:anoctamin-4-like isoform X1 [Neodiprion fabricii]|uniref:anoctamin-4-like isoform X1 n=2 Tax=Neodiprion fabricii TaxID=2872261 RepID=UPI001ED965DD|nr:anoctamin-4-like isoform X1 [Neodiprion fabricii]XP_046423272.1 anoctamin-4-like isoform X1 [Neodiprion fabricii]XP_046423273.1 anoctamin-4-like isoform X1 [Neodiprion fabricii]